MVEVGVPFPSAPGRASPDLGVDRLVRMELDFPPAPPSSSSALSSTTTTSPYLIIGRSATISTNTLPHQRQLGEQALPPSHQTYDIEIRRAPKNIDGKISVHNMVTFSWHQAPQQAFYDCHFSDMFYYVHFTKYVAPDLTGAPLLGTRSLHLDYKYLPCLLYTSPSPRDRQKSRMPSSA